MTAAEAPIIRVLEESGQIPSDALKRARAVVEEEDNPGGATPTAAVIEAVVRTGNVRTDQVIALLAQACGMEPIDLATVSVMDDALESLDAKWARRYQVLPFKLTEVAVHLALSDPFAISTLDVLSQRLSKTVQPYLAPADVVAQAIEHYYGETKSAEIPLRKEKNKAAPSESSSAAPIPADSATEVASSPVVRYLRHLIEKAIECRASDIHIEPMGDRLRVRYRIDGVLHEIDRNSDLLHPSLISRLKLMAELDIAEKRLPQDGRIPITVEGKTFDLRMSLLPTAYGESVVLRLLETQRFQRGLSELGFCPEDQATFRRLIDSPDGMLLVTGPTGSGKTTTLYSALATLNQSHRKIITVEDPVEYTLSGVTQVSVKMKIGVTFASALRAILRQAPNLIMIGEIRDAETAQIAINAALTGHCVYSTLHTNDAAGAVARLRNLGVEPYLISASLRGILAQRLVRRVCSECKKPYTPSSEEQAALALDVLKDAKFVTAQGCPACHHSGFQGRLGIFELLTVDEVLQDMIYEGADHEVLLQQARRNGMLTLREEGLRKAAAGLTTLDEVLSVTVDSNAL